MKQENKEIRVVIDTNIFISGDKKHILPLKKFKDTQILSAVKFLEIF